MLFPGIGVFILLTLIYIFSRHRDVVYPGSEMQKPEFDLHRNAIIFARKTVQTHESGDPIQ
jgi:hypothetical protein